jgi:cell division septation protein DedD
MYGVVWVGIVAMLIGPLAGCSREAGEWRTTQGADTTEAYDAFLKSYPQSEFAAQARERLAQLAEERDWSRATGADTADSYREFLAAHADGKWAQEARVRIENFEISGGEVAATPAAATPAAAAAPAAAVTPVVTTTPAATTSVSHRIQLAAFSTEDKARQEWNRLRGAFPELKGLAGEFIAAQTPSGRVYRLQASVASEARAREICASLKARKQGCLYVAPAGR